MKLRLKKRYGVIYTDPPWIYKNFADSAHGAAQSHYDLLTLGRLKKLRKIIDKWAAKDCIMVMWATWPKLKDAFRVLRAWGFEDYVTGCPWIKTTPNTGRIRTGIGFWFQSASEILLIARRGKPKTKKIPLLALLTGDRDNAVFFDQRHKPHSKKPPTIREWIELKMDGPYLEMFATSERDGWTTYGRALGTEITPNGIKPYKVESATRVVRGKNKARSKYHEPTKETVGLWS